MIGIINVQWCDNPGAVLLAYSLQKKIEELTKDEVVIIDYAVGGRRQINKSNREFEIVMYFLDKLKNKIGDIRNRNKVYQLKMRDRHRSYEQFREEHLVRTKRFYNINADQLYETYSTCIVGSDVVWKPEIANSTDAYVYFLKFAGDRTRKIAYAASIGTDSRKVLGSLKNVYAELIRGFDSISVRENSAASFLQQLTSKPVCQVIDPVFLQPREKYEELLQGMRRVFGEPYLFVYILGYDDRAISFAKKIAKSCNLKIVYDGHAANHIMLQKQFGDLGIERVDIGPIEFIWYIKNADYVISDSFHCTAFSIIFHKEFYTFGRYNNGIDISTRAKEFLEEIGLKNRYVTIDMPYLDKAITFYEDIDRKIEELRKFSICYLSEAIN